MALDPQNKGHLFQIEAGTEGRLKGHKFEEVVTEELNKIDFVSDNIVIECVLAWRFSNCWNRGEHFE